MTLVTNGWYLAAWSDEVGHQLTQRRIADQPVVLFRAQDGVVRALNDACPHRRYPLSLGCLGEDDVIQCGYHGFRFDGDGRCVGVAEQTDVPRAQAYRYPVIEQHGAVWLWPGDYDLADASRLPDLSWLADPAWKVVKGVVPLKARHLLLVENLLDLAHETFLHPKSIGNAAVAGTPMTVGMDGDHTVVFSRRMIGIDAPPFYEKSCGLTSPVDRWQDGEFHAPGIFQLHIRLAPTGTEEPEGFHMKVLYGITPATTGSCHDFYAVGRDYLLDDDDLSKFQQEQQLSVMAEDVDALEIQEIMMADGLHTPHETSIRSDLAAIRARRLLDRLAATEQERRQTAVPGPRTKSEEIGG
jgi:phenylpropionate dioxygenase-like ring-hydroxylating dioxygenase large terminal subunit